MDSVTYSQVNINTAALEADIFTVFDLMAGQLISHSEAHARLRSLYASLRLASTPREQCHRPVGRQLDQVEVQP